MTKIIAELLGATEPLFAINLEHVERASGRPNVDIRLSADIIGMVHQKTKALGLDPKDTTGPELYAALRNLVRLHDQFLAQCIGGTDPNNVAEMLPLIQQAAERLPVPRSAWFLKDSVAKKLLKVTPPKKLMKVLGYRSVDSMLKREPVGALFAGMRFVESDQWLQAFSAKYHKLRPSDFEVRDIEIIRLDNKRWAKAAEEYVRAKHHNVMQVKELGIIIVLPLPVERMAGVTITVLPMLLHAINEIRLYSAYYKLQQVRPDFGKILADSLTTDSGHYAQIIGHRIHWRVVQRHYGKQAATAHPELFEPHLQADDLIWRKVEETLYRLEPALHFWHDLDFVAARGNDGKPISFNLMDMALNYVNQLPFERRVYAHSVVGLWNELYGRYMHQGAIENQVLKQFDNSMFESHAIAISLQGREVF